MIERAVARSIPSVLNGFLSWSKSKNREIARVSFDRRMNPVSKNCYLLKNYFPMAGFRVSDGTE